MSVCLRVFYLLSSWKAGLDTEPLGHVLLFSFRRHHSIGCWAPLLESAGLTAVALDLVCPLSLAFCNLITVCPRVDFFVFMLFGFMNFISS